MVLGLKMTRVAAVRQIGFVSHILGWGWGAGTWVRFAFLVFHKSAATEIGFVSHICGGVGGVGGLKNGFVSRILVVGRGAVR